MQGKWIMTFDDENWANNNFGEFNTKEEIVQYISENDATKLLEIWSDEMGEDLDVDTVYIGLIEKFVPSIDVDKVLEDISESAYDAGGDYAEYYLYNLDRKVESELEDKLNEVLHEWLEKHKLQPSFYSVVSIEEIALVYK